MAKDDRYVRFSSQGRISPDEIANRAFSTQFRGLSEPEVRAWLKRVAAEVDSLHEQEAQLALRLEEVEGRSSTPVELTEERLLTALGEETARVLRSAQEAAADIRRRAEDRSTTVLREAQEEARGIREEAEELLATRTGEAEALASEVLRSAEDAARAMRSEAETATTELRARAAREAEESDEAARRSGREIVEEAQAVRERVLSDLSTRRTLLQAQLEELRAGRDRLIDAYRTVKRTLAEATEALAQVESRASTELTTGPTSVVGVAGGAAAIGDDRVKEAQPRHGGAGSVAVGGSEGTAVSAAEVVEDRTEPEPEPEPEHEVEPEVEAVPTAEAQAQPESEPESEPEVEEVPTAQAQAQPESEPESEPEVEEVPTAQAQAQPEPEPEVEPDRQDRPTGGADEIFARLRSSSDAETDPGEVAAREAADGGQATAEADIEIELPGEEAEGEPSSEAEAARTANNDGMLDEGVLQRRDEALEPAAAALARRLKRIVQDEQNALLDSLRRHRGSGGFDLLLPDVDVQLAERVAVSAPSIDACYREGMLGAGVAVEGSERAPDELAIMLARGLTEPLRARVADGMRDAAARGEDEAGIAETVNARYREWKQQSLESHVVEALAAAFARGTYDALPAGAALRWIVDDPTACPDCDDNSLEVTMKGEPFPTGQLCPPAHPGCRCSLRVVSIRAVVAGAAAGRGSAS